MKKNYILVILIFFVSQAFSQINLSKGLIMYIPLDGNTKDSSSNNNDLTIMKHGSWTNDRFGKSNKAYRFYKDSTWLTKNNFVTPTEFTVSFWVYPFSNNQQINFLTVGNTSQNGFGITMGNGSGGSGNKLVVNASGIQYNITSSSATLNTNEWQHVLVQRKSSKFYLYKDGQLNSSGTDISSADNGVLSVGNGLQQMQNGLAFDGIMDDIRFYNRAVSDSEITTLFKGITTSIIETNQNFNTIICYPNPTTNKSFFITQKEGDCIGDISIFNVWGQKLRTNIKTDNKSLVRIELMPDIKSGVYFVEVTSITKTEVLRIIIQ